MARQPKATETILYLIFGVLTTVINTATYTLLFPIAGNIGANIIAWVVAVAFAFITNKKWVFCSDKWDMEVILKEGGSFVVCRIATGILDMAVMIAGVSICQFNYLITKILANIVVIVLNYVASQWFIFNNSNFALE